MLEGNLQQHYEENAKIGFVRCTCRACQRLLVTFMIKKEEDPERFERHHEKYRRKYERTPGLRRTPDGKIINLTIIIL